MRPITGLLTCAVLAKQVAFCSWSSSRQKEHTLSLQNIETKLVSHCTSQIVRDTLAKAEVVFVGEMIRIMPPELPAWSGIMETFQQVEYKVITLLKGKVNQPDLQKTDFDAGEARRYILSGCGCGTWLSLFRNIITARMCTHSPRKRRSILAVCAAHGTA